MNAKPFPFHGLRMILDCLLIILFILIISAHDLSVHAESKDHFNQVAHAVDPALLAADLEAMIIAPRLVTLDDNTLAAMIAAENAALTESIYFTEMPLITR